jgi:hypothetical protein
LDLPRKVAAQGECEAADAEDSVFPLVLSGKSAFNNEETSQTI